MTANQEYDKFIVALKGVRSSSGISSTAVALKYTEFSAEPHARRRWRHTGGHCGSKQFGVPVEEAVAVGGVMSANQYDLCLVDLRILNVRYHPGTDSTTRFGPHLIRVCGRGVIVALKRGFKRIS